MKKIIPFVCILTLCAAAVFIVECSAEKAQLQDSIIRLHVIANSDSAEDQAQKLRVRDAVLLYLEPMLQNVDSVEDAQARILENLAQIEAIVVNFLQQEGTDMAVCVSLTDMSFDTRYYETFALPAGVYRSLRIELGEAKGQNWWCVAFPSLCLPGAGKSFADVAAGAGFSEPLTDSLSGGNKYEVRFFVLDLLGKIENFLFNR